MSLAPSHRSIRPYAGRDPEFAAAMERAERASDPKPPDPEYVGRTSFGQIKRRNGEVFTPGPHFDPATLEAIPLIDG